jgi:hypothetical protein
VGSDADGIADSLSKAPDISLSYNHDIQQPSQCRGDTAVARITRAMLLTLMATAASAQQAIPTDNDLRSAYCLAVLKGQIPWVREQVGARVDAAPNRSTPSSSELQQANAKVRAAAEAWVAKLQTAQNRIGAYLLPRLTTLDSAAMLRAMNRGETDWREFLAKGVKTDEGTGARIRACADPNWLPF